MGWGQEAENLPRRVGDASYECTQVTKSWKPWCIKDHHQERFGKREGKGSPVERSTNKKSRSQQGVLSKVYGEKQEIKEDRKAIKPG